MKIASLLTMVLMLLLLAPCIADEEIVDFEPVVSFSAEELIAQAPGIEEQMTFDSVFDWDPRVDEQYVTWTQYEGQGKIWFYDMKSGKREMVANIMSDQNNPDISGGIIVWDDNRHGNSNIYSYNIPMHKETPVYVDTTNQFRPAISQDMVVFEDFGNDDLRDIGMVKVGTSARPMYINVNGKDKGNPDIDGDWIAYQQLDDNKNDWNIYLFNYKTDKTVQVTRDTKIQQNPRISGDYVVWEDNRNGKWDIFMYNIKKDMTTAVTFDDYDDVEPSVSGSKIVWTRYDQDGTSDIYMVDLQIPKTYAVCVGPGNQIRPDICVDKVVWQDDRFGGWDIFMYTLQPQTPYTPYQFYGPVTFNYLPAPVGTEIIAKIDGVTKDSIVTTEEGYYGSSGSFGEQLTVDILQADIGRQITFWSGGIQGAPAITVSGDGSMMEQPLNFVYAQPLPDLLFYGSVTIDGQPAAKGTVLKAMIDGVVRGSYEITQSGQYGGQYDTDPALRVPITIADVGKHITFMEGEYGAAQTYQITSGGRFRQDLTFTTVPPMSSYEFYGYVQIDGKSAPAGTKIEAKIDDKVVTTYVTRYAGSYGAPGQTPDDPRLIVPVTEADAGRTISFWIGTIRAGASQVITRGGERIIRKDLDFGGSPHPGINADFTASPRNGNAPLTVQFTDLSTGGPTMWFWDFGDGIIPANATCSGTDCHNIANPIHTYTREGTYTITLTASNQFGASDTEVKQAFITVGQVTPGINADFTASPRSGNTPLTVQFTDLSTGGPTMWFWDFGDGIIPANATCSGTDCNTIANPVHTYTREGTYTVTLTASNQYGASDTEVKQAFITVGQVTPGINADFTASPRSGNTPLTVQFTDLSTGGPTMWFWDFGEGIIPANVTCSGTDCNTIANPVHTYTKEGTYTVTLTASNQFGASDTEVKPGYISAGGSPHPTDSMPIYPGWNFVSVPKKLAPGKDTAAIFSHIQVDGHSIFQYNAVTGQWITLTASSQVKPLDAVWIYSRTSERVSLTYDSDPLQTPPTKELRKGWNAIGFTGLEPLEAKFTFLSVQDKWVNCLGFNEEKQQYDAMIIKGRNDDARLYPYSGYWLFMSDNGTLAAISA
ncbi:PKD domain-containing protein [Methanospirillum sp. J.3.6.1-F.2.7.3]|uniref:PKD domain-containing protein n=1 Tax=Methanospirillum purgamenti TaxID=2834276 RepID=A0A8E7AZ25_9EURY|nr:MULTISPECIES: PKD domain-containing protein [Methanospirillum]MDX8549554.1 PKD domain-containing protein [Methanospirillum hungatei]QVV88939.1 PKD domain-containing protein [Methanospirillum sp. J.3.6.1-F.2.7.3]